LGGRKGVLRRKKEEKKKEKRKKVSVGKPVDHRKGSMDDPRPPSFRGGGEPFGKREWEGVARIRIKKGPRSGGSTGRNPIGARYTPSALEPRGGWCAGKEGGSGREKKTVRKRGSTVENAQGTKRGKGIRCLGGKGPRPGTKFR